ncbi:MAG: polysaccharide deacetylase family protein [Bacteroidetes bacterium]|nr:polysaccharide deacetylase family protein [Bacteroidota bacterium]
MFENYHEIGTIFMLHRVSPSEIGRLSANENMKVSPQFLESFIIQAKSRGYSFISIDSLYKLFSSNSKSKKNIVITLDDGYLDNYTKAFPIFKKYSVPFTVYIPTSFPDCTAVIWWYIIEDIILQNNEIKLKNGVIYNCETIEKKNLIFLELIKLIKSLPAANFSDKFKDLFKYYKFNSKDYIRKLSLDWDRIKEMANNPLVTIGAHTVNHPVLKLMTINSINDEILKSKIIIESRIDCKVLHFSYPFGTRNEVGTREFKISKIFNFRTIVTARHGNIYLKHKKHTESLPRVMLKNDFSWENYEKRSMKKLLKLLVI